MAEPLNPRPVIHPERSPIRGWRGRLLGWLFLDQRGLTAAGVAEGSVRIGLLYVTEIQTRIGDV